VGMPHLPETRKPAAQQTRRSAGAKDAAPGEAGYMLASHQTLRPCCFDDESEEEFAPTGL